MPKFMNLYSFLKMDEHDPEKGGGGGGTEKTTEEIEAEKKAAEKAAADKNKGPQTLEEALAVIKKLNDENAKHRIKNKGLEDASTKTAADLKKVKDALGITDEAETPEQRLASLTQSNEQLSVLNSIMQLQIEHGIGADQGEFFQFLLQKEFAALKDDEELSEEKMAEIIEKVKTSGGGGESSGKTSTSVGGRTPQPQGGKGNVTVEQFANMSLIDRSDLYDKNPALYDQLMTGARQKKLIR